MTIWLVFILGFAGWCAYRAIKNRSLQWMLLAFFWVALAMRRWFERDEYFGIALGLLAGFFILRVNERRRILRDLKEMQRSLGISDERLKEMDEERIREEARNREKQASEAVQSERSANLEKQYRVQAREDRVVLSHELSETVNFPAPDRGLLVMNPGPIRLALDVRTSPESEGTTILSIETTLGDADGREWMCQSLMRVDDLLAPLQEKGRVLMPWANAPERWRRVMKSECRVAGATALLDSRDYHVVNVGGLTYEYFEKYQGPEIDLAWLDVEESWLVRVRKLRREACGETELSDDEEWIPPAAWTLPADKFLVTAHPRLHAADLAQIWDEPEDRSVPAFRLTGKRAAANPGVRLQPSNLE